MHRVGCCYPDYQRLLAAAADHARRALVFSYPPRNALSRAFYGVFNLVMRLTGSDFRGFARRARCLPCLRTTAFGGPMSAAAESGRSLAWNAFRKGGARWTGAW
jgi:magnesium-protoporphyrin O-methyltransferase